MSRSPIAELSLLFDAQLTAEQLFDAFPDVVYFVKDERARYSAVNQALVDRVGARSKTELLGKRADELFPPPFGARYREQDERLLRTGEPVRGELELHVYPSGRHGWCVTHKLPIVDARGRVRGLTGTSRDLGSLEGSADYRGLSRALEHVKQHLDRPLRTRDLARLAGLSPYQLDQRLRRLFGTTTKEHVQRERMDRAMRYLRESNVSIAAIAPRVGYADQSSFTRVFKKAVGTSPGAFRALRASDD